MRLTPPLKTLAVALPFGIAAFGCLFGKLTIPLPGTQSVSDPRELFVTVGSAITGPLGALLIGFLAGVYDPVPAAIPATIAMHVAGGLWMGLSYSAIYRKIKGWPLILAWVLLILVYYSAFLIPVLVTVPLIIPNLFATLYESATPLAAFQLMYRNSIPEIIFTSLTTAIVMALLPPRYRAPIW
jgi:hypothetical protein